MRWSVLLLLVALSFGLVGLNAQESTPGTAAAPADIDTLVAEFNPDLYATVGADATRPVHQIANAFTSPGSDIAVEATSVTGYNSLLMALVYGPFLVLPLLLLLYVVVKFRDRGDNRPVSPRNHNTLLEITWTAIPCLALVVVGIPVYHLLWKMELPPKDIEHALKLEVIGKSFAWDYVYQDEKAADGKSPVTIGQDVAGIQEPVVLEKGRPVVLDITSKDVNHAWWVPAFGVKKDAFILRYTNAWFTPIKTGFYKGQCAELCGQGHGIMIITAVVTTKDKYDQYLGFLRHRDDAAKVWNLVAPAEKTVDAGKLDAAVAGYFKSRHDRERQDALRFWIANNATSVTRLPKTQLGMEVAAWQKLAADRRQQVDAVITRVLSADR